MMEITVGPIPLLKGIAEQRLSRVMTLDLRTRFCIYLQVAFENTPLWKPQYWMHLDPDGVPVLESTWMLNFEAITILNRALELGCKWAEEALANIRETKPKVKPPIEREERDNDLGVVEKPTRESAQE